MFEKASWELPPFLLPAAQQLIPAIRAEQLELSQKVGIRYQLFDHINQCLEDDFLCLSSQSTTHVWNPISAVFTVRLALADLILDQAEPQLNLG